MKKPLFDITCNACGFRNRVELYFCGGFGKFPRPGPCPQCDALGTRFVGAELRENAPPLPTNAINERVLRRRAHGFTT